MVLKTQNIYKLSTKEDKFHLHKILGTSCLIHFGYRLGCLLLYGDMFFSKNLISFLLIGMHGLLSISSLIFNIPFSRHAGKPMIYQEFRLHSIIFALRSVCSAFSFYFGTGHWVRVIIINTTMILADITTRYTKNEIKHSQIPGSTTLRKKTYTNTMRGMPFGDTISLDDQKTITYMHSSAQIGATLFMTINIQSAFLPLFAIQLAAFLMTLVRKNIISELDWHRLYLISLWANVFLYHTFDSIAQVLFVMTSYYFFRWARFQKKINKYLVWNIVLFSKFLIDYHIIYYLEDYLRFHPFLTKSINNVIIFCYLRGQIYNSKSLI